VWQIKFNQKPTKKLITNVFQTAKQPLSPQSVPVFFAPKF